MNFKTNAIVLGKRRTYQEGQKILTVLTGEQGVFDIQARAFGQISKNDYNNLDVLGYYHFNIYQGRGLGIVNSCEPIELFYDLRLNPRTLALAQYFCELLKILVPSNQKTTRHLRLLLNSLWKLKKSTRDDRFIKSVFEFRLMSFSGYMPNLVGCKICYKYESKRMFYIPTSSSLICDECLKTHRESNAIYLPRTVLHALRYIIYKEDKEIFNFKIPDKYLDFLYSFTEYCILNMLEHKIVSLDIYKQFVRKEELK